MKKLLIFSLMTLLVLILAACGSAASPTPNRISIIQGYYDALNAKQIDEVMSFFADDAVLADTTGKFAGQAEIQATLQSAINDNVTMKVSNLRDTDGRVVYDYQVLVNGTLEFSDTGLIIIKDNKIVFEGSEATWTTECNRDASQTFCAEK